MKPIFSLCIVLLACPVVVLGQTSAEQTASQATEVSASKQAVQETPVATPQPAQTEAVSPQETPAQNKEAVATGTEKDQPAADSKPQVQPSAEKQELEKDLAQASAPEQPSNEEFVAARETVEEEIMEPEEPQVVVYNPKSQRDPTLSPDDYLLIQHREQQRLAAIEAERQRKLEEERRKKEEAERLRQLELERIKDPTREVRNKIRIGGVIGQEVFIGSKIYTIGNTIYGARIVAVKPDEVVFSYKGHKFVRKVQL